MLEKPLIDEQFILTRVAEEYGLPGAAISFLPIGADANTAVYRLVSRDGEAFFLKLRKGSFHPASVELPGYLKSLGIQAIISPLEASAAGYPAEGRLWADLDQVYRMILYPYIDGQDGYQVRLTDQQWIDFGAAMQQVHATVLPPALARLIPQETFSPHWRDISRAFLADTGNITYTDPVAACLARFMQAHQAEITHLLNRADRLGQVLQERPPDYVLCHADIHPGNLLISPSGALYIVDWDAPIFAPKERDLLLIGGCTAWSDPRQVELFYYGYRSSRGYHRPPGELDRVALAYYRYQRVIEDIAAFCQQLLGSDEGGEDREQAYKWFISNFDPGHEIDLARKVDTDDIDFNG